jgi:hypothetical protein
LRPASFICRQPRPCPLRSSRLRGSVPRGAEEESQHGKVRRGDAPGTGDGETGNRGTEGARCLRGRRKAVKYRRGETEIVIVIHQERGWFDPLSDAKGDVFSLAEHIGANGFNEAVRCVSDLVGFMPTEPAWTKHSRARAPELGIADRWRARRKPWRGSLTRRYLCDERKIPEAVIRAAIRHDRLREGPQGSMWAAHLDNDGVISGWEERGPNWRGFSNGGNTVLFRLGSVNASRLCVTEAAIDAMSLAAIEDLQPNSLYLSTGGGWAPETEIAIRAMIARLGTRLIAATDNNRQGDVYASRLETIARQAGCGFDRLRPRGDDWNEDLRGNGDGAGKRSGKREEDEMPAACPAGASREASPATRPLTRRTGEAAAGVA